MIIPTYSQFRTNFNVSGTVAPDGLLDWPVSKVREPGSGFGDTGSTLVNIPKPPGTYAPLYISCNNFQADSVPFTSEYRWYSSSRSPDPAKEALIASVASLRFASAVTGSILNTVDGGNVWSKKDGPTGATYVGVARPTLSHGWVVGGSGAIAHTSNSGQTWSAQTSGVPTLLTSVDFISSTVGWACGENGVVLKTVDGGTTWNPLVTGVTHFLHDISFADANIGIACGVGGNTIYTTNGGTTWSPIVIAPGLPLESVDMIPGPPGTGWTVGTAGIVWKTVDGGATYTQQFSGGTTSNLAGVSAVDSSIVYICGSEGFIAKTVDGGASWTQLTTGTDLAFADIKFVTPNIGWAATDSKIYATIDGGTTWSPQPTMVSGLVVGIDSPTVNMGLYTFSGTVQLTPNTSLPASTIMTPEAVATTFKNCHLYVQRISDSAIQWVDLLRAMVANTG